MQWPVALRACTTAHLRYDHDHLKNLNFALRRMPFALLFFPVRLLLGKRSLKYHWDGLKKEEQVQFQMFITWIIQLSFILLVRKGRCYWNVRWFERGRTTTALNGTLSLWPLWVVKIDVFGKFYSSVYYIQVSSCALRHLLHLINKIIMNVLFTAAYRGYSLNYMSI